MAFRITFKVSKFVVMPCFITAIFFVLFINVGAVELSSNGNELRAKTQGPNSLPQHMNSKPAPAEKGQRQMPSKINPHFVGFKQSSAANQIGSEPAHKVIPGKNAVKLPRNAVDGGFKLQEIGAPKIPSGEQNGQSGAIVIMKVITNNNIKAGQNVPMKSESSLAAPQKFGMLHQDFSKNSLQKPEISPDFATKSQILAASQKFGTHLDSSKNLVMKPSLTNVNHNDMLMKLKQEKFANKFQNSLTHQKFNQGGSHLQKFHQISSPSHQSLHSSKFHEDMANKHSRHHELKMGLKTAKVNAKISLMNQLTKLKTEWASSFLGSNKLHDQGHNDLHKTSSVVKVMESKNSNETSKWSSIFFFPMPSFNFNGSSFFGKFKEYGNNTVNMMLVSMKPFYAQTKEVWEEFERKKKKIKEKIEAKNEFLTNKLANMYLKASKTASTLKHLYYGDTKTESNEKQTTIRKTNIVPQCPKGLQYKFCPRSCLNTCSDLGKNLVCSLNCKPGCYCPDGLLFHSFKQKCVSRQNCKKWFL